MNYGESLKEHLARYKRSVLGVEEDGTWSRNGRSYPHILPGGSEDLNLVEPIRDELVAHLEEKGIKKHRDFAHLNSSQAFAFNLFFPWLVDGTDGVNVLDALGIEGRIREWAFEAVLEQEEGTNFDLWLELEGHRQVFIEVKLTETGFGTAEPDERHRRKLDGIYRDRLVGKVRPSVLEPEIFFKHYQLLRNLSYADPEKGHLVCLVFPMANEGARKEAEAFLKDVVLPDQRSSVRIVYAEDVASRLQKTGGVSGSARASLEMVVQKYALDEVGPVGI